MRRCSNCGGFVTATFARVFGDNDGRVDGCPACAGLDREDPAERSPGR